MNYFELHIGDITEATAHLSILEDGAYGRLLRKYYATEKPLPSDVAAVQRLVGARTKEEKSAVQAVLSEFFELQDDGWHQSRCDAEIAAFHEKQIGAEGKRENAKERQRRARERRAAMFEQLRSHDLVPPWTTTNVELELMLSRVTGGVTSQHVTLPVTRDDTATQTPDSKLQTPGSNPEPIGSAAAAPPAPPPSAGDKPLTAKERVWLLGVGVLGEKGRSHLGKLVATYGDDVVAEVLEEALREQPGEPKAWLTAACATRAKAKPAKGPADEFQALLDRDPHPEWVLAAGFESIWQADSAGCTKRNHREFAGGKRIEVGP